MAPAAAALGLLPLLFGDIDGKELERPMAYVILGGLTTSTLLNMLVVPTLYLKWGWDSEQAWERQLALERGEFLDIYEPVPIRGGGASNNEGSSVGKRDT